MKLPASTPPAGAVDRRPVPLRDAIASAGIRADKRLGQHFLLDLNICRKIVRLAGVEAGDEVLEIGPGPGGLTRALLDAGARVVAIEKDQRFIAMLEALNPEMGGGLDVIQADAMHTDLAAVLDAPEKARIVANLPYNVATPLLLRWLTSEIIPRSMTLMFQKEVALRIVAPCGAPDFGRLAVIAQALCHARCVLELPARAFTPPPKVDSAVVHLTPREGRPSSPCLDALQDVTRAAFGQRRKMLRSSLRNLGGEALCARAEIDPALRAEAVPVAGFLRLAEARLSDMAQNGEQLRSTRSRKGGLPDR